MCPEYEIRPVTIAEQARLAAQRHAETGEPQANPHPEGSKEAARWNAGYRREVLHYIAPEAEGSA